MCMATVDKCLQCLTLILRAHLMLAEIHQLFQRCRFEDAYFTWDAFMREDVENIRKLGCIKPENLSEIVDELAKLTGKINELRELGYETRGYEAATVILTTLNFLKKAAEDTVEMYCTKS